MSATGTIETRVAEFQTVGIGQLQESKTNPRQHFAKDALSDLTKSIAEKGVLVPLLVRPHGGKEIGQGPNGQGGEIVKVYEILAGARRYRAAQAAGLNSLPVLIRHLTDTQALEVQVIENLQRADVHPLEEAEGYKQLLEKGKYEIADLAAKVGKSESYIYQRLKLAELVPAAKKAFYEEKISAGHAILLARLQPHEQKRGLEHCTDRWNKPSVRDLGKWIESDIHLDLAKAPWKKDDAQLIVAAGACTTCPKRTGYNKALFPDIAKGDTCTDPQCFKDKQGALVQLRLAETPDTALIMGDYSYSGNGLKALQKQYGGKVLEFGTYSKAGAIKCKDTTEALIVDGEGIGTRIKICTAKRCNKHKASEQSYRPKPQTAAEIAAAKKRREEDELQAEVRSLAIVQMVEHQKKLKELSVAEMQAVTFRLSESIYGDDANQVARAFGLKDGEEITEKWVYSRGRTELAALQLGFLLSESYVDDKDFAEAAKRHGVNLKQLRKTAQQERAKAQTSAKKPAKAKAA